MTRPISTAPEAGRVNSGTRGSVAEGAGDGCSMGYGGRDRPC